LNAVIGDDARDTAVTDPDLPLTQFLGDDFRRSVRVQKAVAQHLANDLIGAAVVGFGAGLLRLQGGQPAGGELVQELIIALATVAETGGDGSDVVLEALAFQEHDEASGLEIGGGDGQGPGGTGGLLSLGIVAKGSTHEAKGTRKGAQCLIEYGVTFAVDAITR
jgi:hypothetical protein